MSAQPLSSLPLSVVILAAGQGKRMHSDLPKVLQPLAGQPLLAHVLDCAARLLPTDLCVVHGHRGEQVRAVCDRPGVTWVLQAEQRGTGHALLQAMPAIADDHIVLVLYGDVPLLQEQTLRQLVSAADARSMALLTVMLDDPSGYGRILRNDDGGVLRIVEHKDASAAQRQVREANSGVLAAPAALLRRWLAQLRADNAQGEYYLTDVIGMAVADGVPVRPFTAPTLWEVLGVNDKVQLAQLETAYRQRRALELMQAGATLIDPARIDLRGEISIGRDVQIDVNVVLQGPVQLGDRVRIGANCVLSNVRVGADTRFKPNCVVEDANIGVACEIGPFSRVRPGTDLGDGVHLGNFVEVKQALIANGTKINHLSYIGDATIGAGVNIGAGTITCNYDGVNKWRTEIGDAVFVGSGVMLVAPLKVGTGATIGAGSTITRDAPPEKLTLERSKQHSIEGWRRPVKQR